MNNISNYVLEFVLSFLGYMFMNLAFPEMGFWRRMALAASWICFYGFMKIVEWSKPNE